MKEYIFSILGVVIIGVLLEIVMPAGTMNKYIKSIYVIFVVAVLIAPITKLSSKLSFNLNSSEVSVETNLLNYIYDSQVKKCKDNIMIELEDNGISNIDIQLKYSVNNDKLIYYSCEVNLENVSIDMDKLHIDKCTKIEEVITKYTELSSEEIVMNG